MTQAFSQLQRILRETSGMAVDDDKRYLVEDRLRGLLRDHGFASLDDLAEALGGRHRTALARLVAETLTINETSFFRDRGLFRTVTDVLVPRLLQARRDRRWLRIWCAGCSTGQEPYSVAMALEGIAPLLKGWSVDLLATDLSHSVIATAKAGTYSQFEVQRGLPVAMLLAHFSQSGEMWRVHDALRAKIRFATQNLLEIPRDAGTFDLVFCRNVLFYFDGETKRRVLGRIADHLAPDGFLALGGAERVGALRGQRLLESDMPFVFRRCDALAVSAERHALA